MRQPAGLLTRQYGVFMEHCSLSPLADILAKSAENGRFALAYSGGLDSRFLAHAARLLGFSPQLLHITGPHVPPEESEFARAWAEGHALDFKEIPVDPLNLPSVAAGTRDRCYECKLGMFTRLKEVSDLPLCDGTNASDMLAYRPGLRAVRELGVISPLALAGLTKKDVHSLAESTGLELPDQKPRPCLLTRLPYGERPTEEVLSAIAAGEHAVRRTLSESGMSGADFRMRLVTRDRLELHMLTSDVEKIPAGLRERLLREAHAAMPGYPDPVLSAQESLSGFFDRLSA